MSRFSWQVHTLLYVQSMHDWVILVWCDAKLMCWGSDVEKKNNIENHKTEIHHCAVIKKIMTENHLKVGLSLLFWRQIGDKLSHSGQLQWVAKSVWHSCRSTPGYCVSVIFYISRGLKRPLVSFSGVCQNLHYNLESYILSFWKECWKDKEGTSNTHLVKKPNFQ